MPVGDIQMSCCVDAALLSNKSASLPTALSSRSSRPILSAENTGNG